jgi:acyl carrier protein
MTQVTASDVRAFLLETFSDSLEAIGLTPDSVKEGFDLLREGVIDSMGILEMIAAIDQRFDVEIDFEDIDPDHITVVDPLCEFVAHQVNRQRGRG